MIIQRLKQVCFLALAILPAVSNSAIITYTDRAAFTVALGGLTTIEEDFNSQSLNLFTTSFSLELGDFVVSSSDVAGDSIGIRDSVYTNGSYFSPVEPDSASVDGTRFFGVNGSSGGPSFDVSFSSERFVFGFDWLDGDVTDSYAMSVLGQEFQGPPFDDTVYPSSGQQFSGFLRMLNLLLI